MAYDPTVLRGRAQGETEDEYRRYAKLWQGEQARTAATARGEDTSGQYWDGTKFKPMDGGLMKVIGEKPWLGAAIALGPAALMALGGGAAAASPSLTGIGAGEVGLTSSALPASAVGSGIGAAGGQGGGMGLGSVLSWLGKGSDALGAVGRVGGVLSGAGQGSADQRMSENDQLLRQGLLRQQQANDTFSNQLRGAEFGRTEQDRQRKAAILSALLNGMQDQSITPGNPRIAERMPQVSGGARPSALTGSKDALMALLSQPGPQAPVYQGAQIPDIKEGGDGEDLLGGAGLISSILGALGKPKPQVTSQRAY